MLSDITEIWEPIKGYEGHYEISSLGRVASIKKGDRSIRKPSNTSGYSQIALSIDGEVRYKLIHRIVAETFVDNPKQLLEVNHIDENKLNNRATNLEWCTSKYNSNHGTRTSRIRKALSKPVVAVDSTGMVIYKFASTVEAGKKGFDPCHISSCCRGLRKSHKGFTWKYVETLEESV